MAAARVAHVRIRIPGVQHHCGTRRAWGCASCRAVILAMVDSLVTFFAIFLQRGAPAMESDNRALENLGADRRCDGATW